MNPHCLICSGKHGIRHVAREKMMGLDGAFTYLECGSCGSLTLLDPPKNIGDYYPPDYYACHRPYNDTDTWPEFLSGMDISVTMPDWLFFSGASCERGRGNILERCVERAMEFYFAHGISRSARILDVGSGSGAFVYWLRRIGFSNAFGIDPLASTMADEGYEFISAASIEDMDSSWDLIVLNHSLEHIDTPVSMLKHVHERLVDGGQCLIRIPIASSYAWEKYGTDWVQLDAPRHYFVPSEQGMRDLLAKAGLTLKKVQYDSGPFQFIGSEAYRKGETLFGENGAIANWSAGASVEEIGDHIRLARIYNIGKYGDQAAFLACRHT